MSDRKIIAVVGATGSQGGGLARAILADPDSDFTVRALTRSPDSDAARELAAAGAEVVEADLDEPETVRRAFAGAYGAFCVTNFWEHFSPEKEKEQARTMAEAAEHAGLEHVIWSTLEDTREKLPVDNDLMPTLMDEYNVPHLDAKGEADDFFEAASTPATLLRTSFYWDNLIHFGMAPQRDDDGTLVFSLPMGDAKLPGIAVEDIGKCAYGIFRKGPPVEGTETVGIAGEHLTGEEMADALGDFLGEEVRYRAVPPDVYRSFDFDGADDLGNMFQYKQEFEDSYCAARPVYASRELNPELMTFEEWLEAYGEGLPVE